MIDNLATVRGYELGQQIGSGGFGAVFRAFQPLVGREVAIKVILPDFANKPDFIRRFESEAQLVARLEHPFIVPLYDYWREPNRAYLVMRLLRGGSLRARLHDGPLDLDTIVKVVDQIAGALAIAHRNGVVHRDLKPDNILMDEDGNAYLTDFGIAKTIADSHSVNAEGELQVDEPDDVITGSPWYISPEQVTFQPITVRTDIYSFGMVVYELLTGQQPFGGVTGSLTELLLRQVREPLSDVRTIRPDLPYGINAVIQTATAKNPDDRYEDVMAFANAVRSAATPDSYYIEDYVELSSAVNPFKGLRPFQEADAADFFGRSALIRRLLDLMQANDPLARFLAVVGPSGSGKSSVVKAGLIPALRSGEVPGADRWLFAEMVPSAAPLEKLEAALLSVAVNDHDDLSKLLKSDKRGLVNAAEAILPAGEEMLLFIDQAEEIFTLVENEAERTHLLALLGEAVSAPDSRIRIIITLRADFYDKPLLYEGFGSLMRARTEVVLPLSSNELEQAIDGPANRVGLIIDPNLLSQIVAEVRDEPGALPLLQYLLTELFERREGNRLTLEAYQTSGGVMGALARRAEEIFTELTAEQQALTRQLFLRLVTLGEGTEDTRRRAHRSEILALMGNSTVMESVLSTFGRYRLLSFDADPTTREPTIEVAHEALIRQWNRLREWLNTSRADVRQERLLAAASAEWRAANCDPSFLLSGVRLSQVEEWSVSSDLALTHEETEFLQASIARRQVERDAEKQRQEHEALLERRSRNRLRLLVAVMGIAAIVAVVLAFLALNEQDKARRRADQIQSLLLADQAQRAATDGKDDLALALALQASQVTPVPVQVQRTLAQVAYEPGMRQKLAGHASAVNGVAISPDGKTALTASSDNSLILWDLQSGKALRTLQGHTLIVTSVAISPDGKTALSGSWDRSIILWNIATGEAMHRFEGYKGVVNGVAYSPDGKLAVSASADGLALIDLTKLAIIQPFDPGDFALSVAFSPDGKSIVVGSQSGALSLWSIPDGKRLKSIQAHSQDVMGVAFSPDGKSLVSASRDNTLIIWNAATGAAVHTLNGHSQPVNDVAWLPSGTSIISASADGDLILWDPGTGDPAQRLSSGSAKAMSVAVSHDGRLAVAGYDDGSVIIWNLKAGPALAKFTGPGPEVLAVAASPDGKTALGALADGTLVAWDIASGGQVQTFKGHTGTVNAVAFSPDGYFAVSASADGTLILWNVGSGQQVRTFKGHNGSVNAVVFSHDGQQIYSGGDDNLVLVWDVQTGTVKNTLRGHTRRVLILALSPDGKTLVSGSADRADHNVLVWDLATNKPPVALSAHTRRVLGLAFSPDGKQLVSVSDDHLIAVWDVAQARQIMRFDANTDPVNAVVYSPDGQTVLTGLATGDVDMWDAASGSLLRQFSGHSKAVTGLAFVPGGAQVLSSSRDGSVILWDTPTLDGLVRWIQANYVVHQFNCDERQRYNIEPLCVAATAVQSAGTQAATANPTSKPTDKPAANPTVNSTVKPTNKPTSQPALSATSTVAAPPTQPTQSSAAF